MALIEFRGYGEASTTKPVLALVAICAILLGSWLRAVSFPHGNAAVKAPIVGLRPPSRRYHQLGLFVPLIYEEMKWALMQEIPPCKDKWVSILGFDTVVRLVVHDFARISVASLKCNKEWMGIQRIFPENVFRVAIQMRDIPPYLKRITISHARYLGRLSESSQRAKTNHTYCGRAQANGNNYNPPDDFLQWLIDEAWNERDGQPAELVHRLLVLALASVHTTSMTATQILYDIIAHPEYLESLRE
ncbi:putative cytochrome p450 protein [Botrytis fragariae]|uniref:Putative cytochrome p450 protein n=1 Tax=Botrytis fragariae TaxID=1964551 RepID=A0A8H6EMD3_9HELO|nr:putative cytochrome p450 protein [Botrytis fragariae]KAF5877454.1 putative cytochrome p450 protein [Botrytis fragariae]